MFVYVFFFQAEDGIRDGHVTGVQTCALPICRGSRDLARFARDLVSLDYAATMGCRACGSAGGGCQFLGTAATSQVVAEALEIGRASCRERVWGWEVEVAVGGRRVGGSARR